MKVGRSYHISASAIDITISELVASDTRIRNELDGLVGSLLNMAKSIYCDIAYSKGLGERIGVESYYNG